MMRRTRHDRPMQTPGRGTATRVPGVLLLFALALAATGCRRPTPVPDAAGNPAASAANAETMAANAEAATRKDPVTLEAYIPCGMTAPFHDAFEAFEAANPAVKVHAMYDNDSLELRLVRDEGKRPDLFVSPGGRELDVLAQKGLIDMGLSARIGSFKVVAVSRRDWKGTVSKPDDLLSDKVKRISLPDPANSSMGWHVRQGLTKLGLWDRIKAKVVSSDRIITAYQAVLHGDADVTFTYRGCPLPHSEVELKKSKARILFDLPLDSYEEPQVAVGVLNTTTHRPEAEGLVHFLSSEPVVKMMVTGHGGSGLPDERGEVVALSPGEGGSAAAPPVQVADRADILAFFPDDADHVDVRALLNSLPQQYPGKVTVEIHSFKDPNGDPEGFKKWQKAGLGCACLLINGRNAFYVGADKHLVRFQRKMEVQWRKDELLDALRQVLGLSATPPPASK
jgi:molybdate transport system substrate-binding protein